MNRVLVYGVKDPAGGVEKVVLDYIRNIVEKTDLRFDLLVFGDRFSQKEVYNQLGCRILYVPVRRKDPVGYKKRIAQIFAENQYKAIWCNLSGLTNIDLLVLGKKYGVPVRIAHSHASRLYWGSPVMKYVVHVLHWLNGLRLDRYATDYWACSAYAGSFMFSAKLQPRVKLIRNAVDTGVIRMDPEKRKAVREQFGFGENTCVVGHVARMCPVKNQAFLLRTMERLIQICPDAKLLFVGDGESAEELFALTEELKLQDYVIFTGSRNDVPDLLCAMDVFVLPSISEGLSVSAVEAQACGLPCVVSDGISPQTDLTGSVTFISLERSYDDWARMILECAGQFVKDPREKLAARGYDIAEASQEVYRYFVGEEQ